MFLFTKLRYGTKNHHFKNLKPPKKFPKPRYDHPKKELDVLVDIPAHNHCLLQQLFFVDVIHKVRHTYLGFKSQII